MFCRAFTRKPETCQNTFWRKAYISSGKKIIWPGLEINPFLFLEGYYCCVSTLDFLRHFRTFLCWIIRLCLIYRVMLHPTVVTISSPHLINFFLLRVEDVTLRRPAVRPCGCREGMEGVAFGGMFLVRRRGVSRQLCDPGSTFQRPLKHKQAPKPAGVARLLLQVIKQIKRGQRWRRTT